MIKFSNVRRIFFGQCVLLLYMVLGWFPNVQAATDCAAVTEIPPVECEALVALYNSTDGTNWLDNPDNNWNVTNTPCSWTKITCGDEHVTELMLHSNQLSGSIPSELGNLSQLTFLTLWSNQLSGPIPSELGNLSQLTSLDLWNNQLSDSIPSELGNLSQLISLILGNNQLSGEIPLSLSSLNNLGNNNGLDLGYNKLTASDTKLISFLDTKDPDWADTQEITETTETTIDELGTPTTTTYSPITIQPTGCLLTSKKINEVCNAGGRNITDLEILANGNLSNAVLIGFLTNNGRVSNLTITQEGHLTDGIVSGYITNEGLMENFEFRGMSITGGTMSGTINNNSKIGGFLRDVKLATDAHIIGGIVVGDIQGDCEAPAKLENISVKSGSTLSCVIIDNGSEQDESVVLAEGVTLGQGVQFAHLTIPSETTEEETPLYLPPLSETIAINAQGKTVDLNTLFAAGIAVNNGSFEKSTTASLSDSIDIRGRIEVDIEHVEQSVDISVVIGQIASDDTLQYSMLDTNGDFIPWDADMESLESIQTVEASAVSIEVQMYNGQFEEIGVLNFYFGYRLADGMVVYSPDSLKVTIVE